MKLIITIVLIATFKITFAQHSSDSMLSAPKPTSVILLEQVINRKYLKNNMVRFETVTFPPGYSSKRHIHPCPLFVYILEGELLSEFEGVKKVYKAGDIFYEKPEGLHSITQNYSLDKPAKILVVYLMKEGMETFIAKDINT